MNNSISIIKLAKQNHSSINRFFHNFSEFWPIFRIWSNLEILKNLGVGKSTFMWLFIGYNKTEILRWRICQISLLHNTPQYLKILKKYSKNTNNCIFSSDVRNCLNNFITVQLTLQRGFPGLLYFYLPHTRALYW